jgi:hypothetical protein
MMGAGFLTKKGLKEAVGQSPRFVETSVFGPEYKGDGKYNVVGPHPHVRKWYATVTIKNGLIVAVK